MQSPTQATTSSSQPAALSAAVQPTAPKPPFQPASTQPPPKKPPALATDSWSPSAKPAALAATTQPPQSATLLAPAATSQPPATFHVTPTLATAAQVRHWQFQRQGERVLCTCWRSNVAHALPHCSHHTRQALPPHMQPPICAGTVCRRIQICK